MQLLQIFLSPIEHENHAIFRESGSFMPLFAWNSENLLSIWTYFLWQHQIDSIGVFLGPYFLQFACLGSFYALAEQESQSFLRLSRFLIRTKNISVKK